MPLSPSLSILVAEDSQTALRIVRNILAHLGFRRVDLAENGLDALVKMAERKYDLIIADWNMEPMSGYELLRQIRADRRLAKIPVVLMTAASTAENVLAAKKAGATSFIAKPFTAEALLEKLQSSLLF
jgi:two-component system chemotaxis response regulator CheY